MIPKNALYQGKKESAPGRRYRTNIQPQSGSSFTAGQTITINIPTRANTLLIPSESTLNFNTTVTSTANQLRLESCGAHAFIQRIRVYHGSNLLEDIDAYGVLSKVLMDYVAPEDMIHGKGNILMGTRAGYWVTGATVGTDCEALPVNSGAIITTAQVQTYNLNLISILGSLSAAKYLPLFAMTSAPIRLEIQLVAKAEMALLATSAAVSAWTVDNVEYVGEFLELGDSAIATIMNASSPLQYVVPSFRNYQWVSSTLGTGSQIAMPIPAKFSSLKSLFVTSRNSTDATGQAGYFPLASLKNGLASFQFRIGSQVVPSKAPSTNAEFAIEAFKCFASLADLNHQPSIDVAAFNTTRNNPTTAPLAYSSNSGSFLIGLDCEVYAGADKSEIFQGLNTNTDDIYLNATYGTVSDGSAYRYDAFANFDQVLVCENGVAYTRF